MIKLENDLIEFYIENSYNIHILNFQCRKIKYRKIKLLCDYFVGEFLIKGSIAKIPKNLNYC